MRAVFIIIISRHRRIAAAVALCAGRHVVWPTRCYKHLQCTANGRDHRAVHAWFVALALLGVISQYNYSELIYGPAEFRCFTGRCWWQTSSKSRCVNTMHVQVFIGRWPNHSFTHTGGPQTLRYLQDVMNHRRMTSAVQGCKRSWYDIFEGARLYGRICTRTMNKSPLPNHKSLRCCWQTRATQCLAPTVLYTDVDGQCDKRRSPH